MEQDPQESPEPVATDSTPHDNPPQPHQGEDLFSVRKRVVAEFEAFERNFRSHMPISWITSLLGPLVITLLILLILWATGHGKFASQLVGHALMTFFLFGRLIILVGGEEGAKVLMTPVQLFFMVTYLDLMVAVFVAFHMGFLFKLPYFGKMLAEFVGDGQYLLKRNPWIRNIAYFGLVLFVVFPTSTTGSVGGSIFGRLLGLGRWTTVSAIAIGSVLGNGLMLVLSNWLSSSDFNNPWFKIAGVLALVGIFVLLERRYRAMKRNFIELQRMARQPGTVQPENSDTDGNTSHNDPVSNSID